MHAYDTRRNGSPIRMPKQPKRSIGRAARGLALPGFALPGFALPRFALPGLALLGFALLLASCGDTKDLPNIENTAPEILNVVAEPEVVFRGESLEVTCTAEDGQLDPISYIWSTEIGEFYGTRDDFEISWRAPEDYEGEVEISVVATDGKDESLPSTIMVEVVGERGSLSGTVSQSGTGDPLIGATVAFPGFTTQTDTVGVYTLEDIPIGNYTIEASLEGYESSSRNFEVKDGPNTLNFTLTQIGDVGTVFGQVTNSLGAPVEGATCRIVGRELETQTDANGDYSIGSVPRDSFTIQVNRPGYVNFSDTLVLDGPELEVDVTLVTEAPGEPSNVVATKSGLTLTVTWDPPTGDTIGGYQLYWKIDTASTVAVPGGRLDAGTTEFSIGGEQDRRYRFLVAAINIEDVEGSDLGVSNDLVLTSPTAWVEIPSGSVVMGSAVPGGTSEREVPHPGNPITVPAFRIEETEVTNQQYFAFLWEATSNGFATIVGDQVQESGNSLILFGASKLNLEGNAFTLPSQFANHPVAGVTWYGAEAYARFHGRRLPSEAEWERAARGSSQESGTYPGSDVGYGTRYPWGNEAPTMGTANFGEQVGTTRAVRSLPLGATTHWGGAIYELSGNVWEWCQDWYGVYSAPHSPPENGTLRVLRGGSLHDDATWLSTWARFFGDPEVSSPRTGFRCAQ